MKKTVGNLAKKDNRDNLTPWQPGQSGNPSGRPRGTISLRTILRAQLRDIDGEDHRTAAERLVAFTLKAALDGDPAARKLVWSMVDDSATFDNPYFAESERQIDEQYQEERILAALEAAEAGGRYVPGGDIYLWYAQRQLEKDAASLAESSGA